MAYEIPTKKLGKRAFRFSLSGIFVTALHTVIAILMIEAVHSTPAIANGVAFIASTIASYLINTLWSFSNELQWKTILRFIAVSSFGLALTVGISGYIDLQGLQYSYGIIAVVCTVPPVTFLLHNYWTYGYKLKP